MDYAPITRIYEWYVRDHWRMAQPRVTLDIGVRFTWALPQTPNNDNAGNFVPYLYDPAQAPTLYRRRRSTAQNVTINPITGAVVHTGRYWPG